MIEKYINTLADFCGVRDIPTLNRANLIGKYGIEQADVMVLFGGSIICGGDVLAEAIHKNIAKKYIIVGGEGHTTQSLRDYVHLKYPEIDTKGKPESIVFNEYLKHRYGIEADYIETQSTNCGNNITLLLDLIEKNGIDCNSIILSQDATMQRRMAATLRKYRPELTIINYAVYNAHVKEINGKLCYTQKIDGMWEADRYISLLLGEISRLTDNEDGYGPNGKGFIAHEDIPLNVIKSFEYLKKKSSNTVREANPEYANVKSR